MPSRAEWSTLSKLRRKCIKLSDLSACSALTRMWQADVSLAWHLAWHLAHPAFGSLYLCPVWSPTIFWKCLMSSALVSCWVALSVSELTRIAHSALPATPAQNSSTPRHRRKRSRIVSEGYGVNKLAVVTVLDFNFEFKLHITWLTLASYRKTTSSLGTMCCNWFFRVNVIISWDNVGHRV